jgi:hypothetical protein
MVAPRRERTGELRALRSPIQSVQIRRHEHAVVADDLAVEADGAAAVVGALDADEVPVDLALVTASVHIECQSLPGTAWRVPCGFPRCRLARLLGCTRRPCTAIVVINRICNLPS